MLRLAVALALPLAVVLDVACTRPAPREHVGDEGEGGGDDNGGDDDGDSDGGGVEGEGGDGEGAGGEGGEGEGTIVVEGSGTREGAVASAECNDLCAGVGDEAELSAGSDAERATFAACFSCRCHASIGWTPPADELRCSTATELDKFRFATDGSAANVVTRVDTIDPHSGDTTGCLNGGIGAAGCDLLSRHKRMVSPDGSAEYQMVCRRPYEEDVGYYEYLIIGNNVNTGATCFWQARQDFGGVGEFDGEDTADLDVFDRPAAADDAPREFTADDAKVQKYVDTYYLYSAGPSTCTSCHASDAFLWSPYFASAYPIPVADETASRRLFAPYFQVSAASQRLQPVNHSYLVAGPAHAGEPATPLGCADCHRVADGSFCSSFAWQALGQEDRNGLSAFDPSSAFAHAPQITFWMPPGPTTYSEWQEQAGDDLERIRACCVDPSFDDGFDGSGSDGDADCVWSDAFE